MTTGPLAAFLIADHRRLEGLLRASAPLTPGACRDAFEQFRAGLLKHVAMEERLLLPAAKRARVDSDAVWKHIEDPRAARRAAWSVESDQPSLVPERGASDEG